MSATDLDEFITELRAANQAFFSQLARDEACYWPVPLTGRAGAEALEPRWYNEARGAKIIARFAERVDNPRLALLVQRQVADEAKHARLCHECIVPLGSDVTDFRVSRSQRLFGDALEAMQYPEEFFAAQQFTVETESIKRNELALQNFDPVTADIFRRHVNPDERFHARLGELGLRAYATTPAARARAFEAAKRIREVHVAMVREHGARMRAENWFG